MTLLVKDEDDILKENIEFHLANGVDYIIALDNNSTDNTSDILRSFEKQKVLHYIHETSNEYNQSQWVTNMARIAFQNYKADWIINNDADEFWLPINNKTLKQAILENITNDIGSLTVSRHNFVCIEGSTAPFYESLIYRYRGCVQPKCLHRGFLKVKVSKGNHSVQFFDKQYTNTFLEDIKILHFPYRNLTQFTKKTKNIINSVQNNKNWTGGHHWKKHTENTLKTQNINLEFQKFCLTQKILTQKIKKNAIVKDERLFNFFINK